MEVNWERERPVSGKGQKRQEEKKKKKATDLVCRRSRKGRIFSG